MLLLKNRLSIASVSGMALGRVTGKPFKGQSLAGTEMLASIGDLFCLENFKCSVWTDVFSVWEQ